MDEKLVVKNDITMLLAELEDGFSLQEICHFITEHEDYQKNKEHMQLPKAGTNAYAFIQRFKSEKTSFSLKKAILIRNILTDVVEQCELKFIIEKQKTTKMNELLSKVKQIILQQELVDLWKISQSTVSLIFSGKKRMTNKQWETLQSHVRQKIEDLQNIEKEFSLYTKPMIYVHGSGLLFQKSLLGNAAAGTYAETIVSKIIMPAEQLGFCGEISFLNRKNRTEMQFLPQKREFDFEFVYKNRSCEYIDGAQLNPVNSIVKSDIDIENLDYINVKKKSDN